MAQIETTDLDRVEKEALLILDNLQKNYHGCVREGVYDILEIVNKVRDTSPGKTCVWWDTATGGFYLSKASVPDSVLKRGGVVELARNLPLNQGEQDAGT